jgi:8-oxo-dGTP pyrophosphatase MutT (NUDIX family)
VSADSERFRAIVAVHILLLRGESILLLRRAGTGYEDGNYSVPAGHLDGGETVTDAAIRETMEEVGVALSRTEIRHALVMHRRAETERIDFFMSAASWKGEPTNCELDKCDELRWVPLAELPENVIPYVRRALAAFGAGEMYVEFGWD